MYMDPQKLSQLDPKLREAYQRVMGTVIPKPQSPPAQTQTPPPINKPPIPDPISTPPAQPQPEPATPPATQPKPFFIPQPPTNPQPEAPPAGEPTPQSSIPTQSTSNFTQMNSEVAAPSVTATVPVLTPNFTTPASQTQTAVLKKKGNMLIPAMIVITILVFIVVYGLFWARIFNLNLPFLL